MTATPQPGDRWLPLIPIGLGLVVLMFAVFFGMMWRHQGLRGAQMLSWPSVEGTITGCGVSPFRRSGQTQDELHLVTSLSWKVDGHDYALTSSEYLGWASAEATRPLPYTRGQQVTVFYDPQDPQSASLTNKADPPNLVFLLVAGFCALLSSPFLFFGGRGLWRNRQLH